MKLLAIIDIATGADTQQLRLQLAD